MALNSDQDQLIGREAALLEVAREVSSARDSGQLLDRILERARGIMGCELCSILIPEDRHGDLLIRSTHEVSSDEPVRVPAGKGIAGKVLRDRASINVPNAVDHESFFGKAAEIGGISVGPLLAVPLLDGDQCLGVMEAINPPGIAPFSEDDVDTFTTLASLTAVTLLRLESHRHDIEEAERRQEMALCHEVQGSLLPKPESFRCLDVEAFYEPASAVGGDFYFWHRVDRNRVLLGLGDVCGKGMPAAIDMAKGSTLVAASVTHLTGPNRLGLGVWVVDLNQKLCRVMSAGRFIALAFVLIDQSTRRFEMCMAGIPMPKLFENDSWIDCQVPANPALGISHTANYQVADIPLSRSPHILLFSDGITELQNRAGKQFEDGAFEASLQRSADEGPGRVLEILGADWDSFTRAPKYQDDTTMLLVTDTAPRPKATIEVECAACQLSECRDFVKTWTTFCALPERTAGLVVLGCDEVLTNLCKHAFSDRDADRLVRIEAQIADGSLLISISHEGEGISNEQFAAMKSNPSDQPRAGGMGLHVIGEVFDQADFGQSGDRFEILLKTHLE